MNTFEEVAAALAKAATHLPGWSPGKPVHGSDGCGANWDAGRTIRGSITDHTQVDHAIAEIQRTMPLVDWDDHEGRSG